MLCGASLPLNLTYGALKNRVVLDLEKCQILPVPNSKVLNKVKCSIGISAKSCAALNHVATWSSTFLSRHKWLLHDCITG